MADSQTIVPAGARQSNLDSAQTKPHGDLLAGHPTVAAQAGDHGEPGRRLLVGDQVRCRAPVLQAGMAFDHNNRPDDDDQSERLYDCICELRRLICTTPPTTLDGFSVQLEVMFDELADGSTEETQEAWRLARACITEMEGALRRLGMAQTVMRECWGTALL